MYTCFIICPFGESGTETRTNADDLRDLIIRPALEPFGFRVERGDDHVDQSEIDSAVIRAVQEADLCVVDISQLNANVFYELGRRDETGKPVVLIRSVNSEKAPMDIAARRYVEYDLDSRRGIIDACNSLKDFVEPFVKQGFEASGSGASLGEIAEILKRVERKVDRIKVGGGSAVGGSADIPMDGDVDPVDLLNLSMRQKNIPMAEKAMSMLQYRMQRIKWLDQVVEQVAVIGSVPAGNILIENAMDFVDDTATTFHQKVEYLACLVGNLMKTDREAENCALVEQMYESIKAVSDNQEEDDRITLTNQMNRLYYGIFATTREPIWLDKAIQVLEAALEIGERDFLYFNLSICENARNNPGDAQLALEHALRCIELDGDQPDDAHLEHACKLLHEFEDPRLIDFLDALAEVNPIKAKLLRSKWNM